MQSECVGQVAGVQLILSSVTQRLLTETGPALGGVDDGPTLLFPTPLYCWGGDFLPLPEVSG